VVVAAAVQLVVGEDKATNLARLTALVGQAADAGARLVVAPEATMHGFGGATTPLAPVAEPLDGPFVTALSGLAARHRLTLLAGMFEPAEDPGHAYNTVVALGPDGALLGAYRKQHLFDALGWVESQRLQPGPVGEQLVLPVDDVVVGVMTCYDLRFPELGRALVDAGATALAVPAAWVGGPGKEHQWRTLVTARAIENVAYVVAAGQAPPGYSGASAVVDPFGVGLATLGEVDGVAVATLDPARVAACRERMPSLDHRRWRVEPAR
jgi:deaminated glutathione amidase